MFVEVSHIPTIVAEFVTTVVMPKAPTGLMKFGIGFVSPYIRDAVAARVDQYMPTLKMLGIVTEEGKVELSGYIMDKADIDALLEIAKKFAVD